MPINSVYVLEDHPQTLKQLCDAVEGDERLELFGSGASLAEAQVFLESNTQVDAVLADLGLPDGNGIDFIKQLQQLKNKPKVLVITAFGDDRNVISAIEAGATGYLLKERQNTDIADAICSVLAGESPISPSIARHLLKRFQSSEAEPKSIDVTAREIEVLQMIVKGFTFKEIAENMEISVNTISSHVQNIYEKMSVNSRSEAAFEAVQLGLVKL